MRHRDRGLVPRQVAGAAAPAVYQALKGEMGGKLHALALQTGMPDAAEDGNSGVWAVRGRLRYIYAS
jgi:hypothetical protein